MSYGTVRPPVDGSKRYEGQTRLQNAAPDFSACGAPERSLEKLRTGLSMFCRMHLIFIISIYASDKTYDEVILKLLQS